MIASKHGWRVGSGEPSGPARCRVIDVQPSGTHTVLLLRHSGGARSSVEVPARPDRAAAVSSLAGLRRVLEVRMESGIGARASVIGIGGRHRLVQRQISLPSALALAGDGVRTTVVCTAITA